MTLVPIEQSAALAHGDRVTLTDTLARWREAADLAKAIARTEFVPKALFNKPESVMAALLRADELGLSPLQGLSQIHVIDGRPGLAAELMRALVLSQGHELWIEEWTNTRCTLVGRRAGSDNTSKITWTIDDAKTANLLGKDNWRKYPRDMLLARASSQLCRLMFPDVIAGMSYSVEEIEDGFDFDEPAAGEATAPPLAKRNTRKAAAAKPRAVEASAREASNVVPFQPPQPPLPGEEPDAAAAAPATDDESVKIAQQIAMRARDVGVDHHQVVAAVTNGVKTSAKDLTGDEAAAVHMALHNIRAGKVRLVQTVDGWRLVDPGDEPEKPFEELLEEKLAASVAQVESVKAGAGHGGRPAGEWNADDWRAFLKDRKVKVTELLREAQQLAHEDGDPPPTTLDALSGRGPLCELLVSFADGLAAQRGGQ